MVKMATVPALFESSYSRAVSAGQPQFEKLEDLLRGMLENRFKRGEFVLVKGRVKDIESAYAKCLLGKYDSVDSLGDLFGLTVVMLRRSDLRDAIRFLQSSNRSGLASDFELNIEDRLNLKPSDFRFSESKGSISYSPATRHDQNKPLQVEIQFTTATQHSLDLATHDFDYKGDQIAWERFRAVSRLRAIAEQLDLAIDQITKYNHAGFEDDRESTEFARKKQLLEPIMRGKPSDIPMPRNVIRLVEIIEKWLDALSLQADDLEGFQWPADLVDMQSVTTEEKIFAGIYSLALNTHDSLLEQRIDPAFRFLFGGELEEENDIFHFDRIPARNRFNFD